MNESANGARRRAEIEAWWALIARILAFFLGAAMLLWQTINPDDNRLLITCAAIALMGPAVATTFAQVVTAMRGERK